MDVASSTGTLIDRALALMTPMCGVMPEGELLAVHDVGDAYCSRCTNRKAAEKLLEQAWEQDTSDDLSSGIGRDLAQLMNRLGLALMRGDRDRMAKAWMARSLSIYQSLRDEPGITSVHCARAEHLRHQGERHLALAQRSPKRRDEHLARATALLVDAIDAFTDVLHREQEHGDARQIALAVLNLAEAYIGLVQAASSELNHLNTAAQLAKRAHGAFAALAAPDPLNAARTRTAQGRVELLDGHADEATMHFAKAFSTFALHHDRLGAASTLVLLADAAELERQPRSAIYYLMEAQRLYAECGGLTKPDITQRIVALKAGPRASDERQTSS